MTESWPYRTAVLVTLAALVVTCESRARADDATAARKDFRTGLSLLRQGEQVSACRMFERSYLEEAAPGTLYNLSLCREHEGRLDEAYRGYVELIDVAETAHDTAKAEAVKQKATTLRARLARLDLSRRQDVSAAVTGLAVDGTVLPNDAWKAPVYVMPGTHQLSIKHDDGITVTRTTSVLRAGQTEALVIDEPREVPPPPAPPLAAAESAASPPPSGPMRTAAYATSGAAVALLGAGAVLGLLAVARKNAADDACRSTGATCATSADAASAQHDIGTARTESTLSTLGFAAGASAAAVATVLFVVGRSSPSPTSASAGLAPSFVVAAHAGGLALTGRF